MGKRIRGGFGMLLVGWLLGMAAGDAQAGSSEHDQQYAAWRETYWAAVRADYQYLDHSLGGHRIWCETDGLNAVRSFLAFREREMARDAGITE
jgi:hypothetical protein